MYHSVALSNRTSLKASVRMQQAVRLLQMSSLEFNAQFEAALNTNPFLENDVAEELADVSKDESARDALIELPLTEEHSRLDPFELLATHKSSSAISEGDELCARLPVLVDLREHLNAQVCGHYLNEEERVLAEAVIETLDDDGYLRENVEETLRSMGFASPICPTALEASIKLVQEFDPPGIAARSLGECLYLQLLALPNTLEGHALALALVRDSLPLLATRDFFKLGLRHDATEQALLIALALIQRLEPHPGHRFSLPAADYVVPDVIVLEEAGGLKARVNPAMLPKARLNEQYIGLLRQQRDGAHPAMQQQLQEARWLMRNAEQRFSTIQKVADAILRRQRAFFVYGDVALRPLVLREIAEEVGLHESTISRATGNKTMATPRGLYQFKHFFSQKLGTETGGACSATAVRALMRDMLEVESTNEPLSDVVLAHRLTEQGIRVARRNQMKVPPAELRRRA